MIIAPLTGHGRIDDAMWMFGQMLERSMISWTGYAKGGFKNKSFKLFQGNGWRGRRVQLLYSDTRGNSSMLAWLRKRCSIVCNSKILWQDEREKFGNLEHKWYLAIENMDKIKSLCPLWINVEGKNIYLNDITFLLVLSACSYKRLLKGINVLYPWSRNMGSKI